ncbi:sigma-70 family RNA polymerase sigma factor [Nocardia thailandica]|uniref:Sigma-70 family RNA polymerase sigma factor n=1 Tax=Nocardia thailandica TaxID=257275 RepID=A0ABW6PP98_9NOCA
MREEDTSARRFEAERPRLLAVAYRLLGSAAEAEDAVQEAWFRLDGAGEIERLRPWLTTVVSRICLDMLRSRAARREEPGAAGDEFGADPAAEPENEAVLADAVGRALLVVMDALRPDERVAFVLHDLFAVPFDQIAPIVGRTPATTKKLASRARARVRAPGDDAAGGGARVRDRVPARSGTREGTPVPGAAGPRPRGTVPNAEGTHGEGAGAAHPSADSGSVLARVPDPARSATAGRPSGARPSSSAARGADGGGTRVPASALEDGAENTSGAGGGPARAVAGRGGVPGADPVRGGAAERASDAGAGPSRGEDASDPGAAEREVVAAFLRAAREGDLAALLAVLAPEVVRTADPAALPPGMAAVVRGAAAVAGETVVLRARARVAALALVDGAVGIVVAPRGRLLSALRVSVAGGRVTAYEVVADPARLRALEVRMPPGWAA